MCAGPLLFLFQPTKSFLEEKSCIPTRPSATCEDTHAHTRYPLHSTCTRILWVCGMTLVHTVPAMRSHAAPAHLPARWCCCTPKAAAASKQGACMPTGGACDTRCAGPTPSWLPWMQPTGIKSRAPAQESRLRTSTPSMWDPGGRMHPWTGMLHCKRLRHCARASLRKRCLTDLVRWMAAQHKT